MRRSGGSLLCCALILIRQTERGVEVQQRVMPARARAQREGSSSSDFKAISVVPAI